MATVLVTGGTGVLGRPVVDRLLERGSEVRVLSRHPKTDERAGCTHVAVDLRRPEGLDAALDGVDTVIHCATSPTGGDVRAARNLLDAAKRAGKPHVVYISIVGVDRIPFPYYKTKLSVERLIEGAGLDWTVLRATQFHDLVAQVLHPQRKLPIAFVLSRMPVQPVDASEVAARLVELSGTPAGRADDMGGPEVREFADLARVYLGAHRRLVPVTLPGKTFAAFRAGWHTAPEHADGQITFEQYLEQR